MKNRKTWLGWRLAAGFLTVLCLVPIGFYLLLQTGEGREWLARRISLALSSDQRTVEVEHIRVALPARVVVEHVSVRDAGGVWMTIRGMELRASLHGLLAGRIDVRQVHVTSFDLERLPVTRGGAEPVNPLPLSLWDFCVEDVALDEVRVGANAFGSQLAVSGVRGLVKGGASNGVVSLNVKASAGSVAMSNAVVEHVSADVDMVFERSRWGLPRVDVRGDGLRVLGGLGFAGGGMWPTGNMGVEADGAARWARSLWPGLSEGRIKLALVCAPRKDDRESMQVELAAAGLRFNGCVASAATMQVQLHRTRGQLDLWADAKAHVEDFSVGLLTVTGAEFHVSGPWRSFDVAGTAGGVAKQPFTTDVAGRLHWDGSRYDVELQRATVEWSGIKAGLLEPFRLRDAGAQTAMSGRWRTEAFDLASIPNIPFGSLAGRVTADVSVRGSLANPELDGRVTCERLAANVRGFTDAPIVNGSCDFGYSNAVLRASVEAKLVAGGMAMAKAELPMQLSFHPWVLSLDRDRDLPVTIEADLNLAVLSSLDAFVNGRISGRLNLSVLHVGSLASGKVTGTCLLVDGEYENYVLGTVIRKAGVRLVVRDDKLVVDSGSATDGGQGRFTLAGGIHLSPIEGLPYEFEVTCRQARLLRRPDAEITASGKLSVTGTVSRIRVDGDVQIDNTLVELQNLRPSPPAALEPLQASESVSAVDAKDRTHVTVRLAVAIPGTLYVRSRTLDSAWEGNLVLGYAGGMPSLSGYLEPRRGTILLLKRPFKLTEGRITFDGVWPPSPALRLTAAFSRADLSAHVLVVGSMRDPEITLTSEPSLPEDEILARILFGKEMSNITPLQALLLASEAAKLRQVGGGAGLLADVQSRMGIDRVELREAGQGTAVSEVAAGKYLGDRSYVEMRRTTSTEQSAGVRLYLEHELRPNIVLEAEGSQEMRSGVGLFWKWDY